jgi:GntR family transcriptional regulator/MocR family aminotransferase
VARGTVVSVYEQLRGEGYLTARVGSGTRVNDRLPDDQLPLPEKVIAHRRAEPSASQHAARPFRADIPAIEHFPFKTWSRLLARYSWRAEHEIHAGAHIAGYLPLRRAVVSYLAAARGVIADPQQVVIVSGVQQALDTLARVVAGPDAEVAVEDPAYFGAISAFSRSGVRIVPIPVDDEGLLVSEASRRSASPRLIYATPGHQFATGVALSARRRLQLLAWAERRGAYIVEDDYDSEFRFSGRPIPALKSIDAEDRVIHLGTFNKSMFPALRLGFMVLPDALLDKVLEFRRDVDRPPPGLAQAALAEFIDAGHFSRHLRRTRVLYAGRLTALRESLQRHLGGLVRIPSIEAGLLTPAYFETQLRSAEGERLARAAGLHVHGLHRVCLERSDLQGLLLGFACLEETQIEEGVQSLAQALSEKRPA